jgi:hypothetical protein
MAAADLAALRNALLSGRSLRPYVPEDREAEAAKTKRLRQLRLAKEGQRPPRPPSRRAIVTR